MPPDQVALAYPGLWRVEHAFRSLTIPLEFRPLFHTSESGVRGYVVASVLAYSLVRIIVDRLDAAGLDLNAKDALQRLDSIHHVAIDLGNTHVERTSTPTTEHDTLLRALKAEAGTKTHAL